MAIEISNNYLISKINLSPYKHR